MGKQEAHLGWDMEVPALLAEVHKLILGEGTVETFLEEAEKLIAGEKQ